MLVDDEEDCVAAATAGPPPRPLPLLPRPRPPTLGVPDREPGGVRLDGVDVPERLVAELVMPENGWCMLELELL